MNGCPFESPEDIPDWLLEDTNLLELLASTQEQAYFTFQARPDQPERWDMQTSFLESKTPGVKILLGGNGAGTTTTCVRALCRFAMETPPPRKDCPIWVIAPNLEMSMKTVFGEKMLALGHLPRTEIDWDRIAWFKPRQDMPFAVPLLEWPDRPGKNWTFEFRGWSSGRTSLQGRAIGGFLFVEQAPYDCILEVLRGCREFNFPGSKLIEFTPVDPNIGTELLDAIEADTLEEGWEVYYLNTMCNMEAGHVDEVWFKQFFGMVPEEMLETRMTGKLPKWEGLIYSNFNPTFHVVGDDVIDHPDGIYYRRSIDWGSGPENPFACVFAYKNGLGQWFIFDEYYSAEPVTVHEHLKAVCDLWKWPANHPCYGTTYADPSAAGFIRIADRFSQYVPGYPSLHMTSAVNDVLPGIEYVQWLMQIDPALADPDHHIEAYKKGQPRLFIHEKCKNLIKELRKYRWQKGSGGANPTDGRVAPVKKEDHALDALRYVLFSERQLGNVAPMVDTNKDEDSGRHGVHLDRGRTGKPWKRR